MICRRIVQVAALAAVIAANCAAGPADVSGASVPSGLSAIGGLFRSVGPVRLLATARDPHMSGGVPAGATVQFTVGPRAGVPAGVGSAVALQVTVSAATSPGSVVLKPAGVPDPRDGALRFAAGQPASGMVIAPLPKDGVMDLVNRSTGKAQFTVALAGFFTAGGSGDAGAFTPLPFRRVIDSSAVSTAAGGRLAPGQTLSQRLAGHGGVPAAGVSAVALTVAAVHPSRSGRLAVDPGARRDAVSFHAHHAASNLVVVPLDSTGSVQIQNASRGAVAVVGDIAGYFTGGAGASPGAVTSVSAAQLTPVVAGASRTVPGHGTVTFRVAGQGGLPSGHVQTVGVEITATRATGPGSLSVYPAEGPRSRTSAVEYRPGQRSTQFAISRVAGSQSIAVHNNATASVQVHVALWTYTRQAALPTVSAVSGTPLDPQNNLWGLSCASTTFCVAVDSAGQAFFYDGTTWSAPQLADPGGELTSISCPSTGFCVAVDEEGRAVTYTGSGWTTPTHVNSGRLLGVSCPTTTRCWAVGHGGDALPYRNGVWSAPLAIDGHRQISSVSCPTTVFCGAVDVWGNGLTMIGNRWSAPVRLTGYPGLLDVSCTSDLFCAAGGYSQPSKGAYTFNGNGWTIPTGAETRLESLDCATSQWCVGSDIETSNGVKWRGYASDNIDAMSCPQQGFCVGVGIGEANIYETPT